MSERRDEGRRGIGRTIVAPAALLLLALLGVLGAVGWWRLGVAIERAVGTRAQVTALALIAGSDISLAVSPGDSDSQANAAHLVESALAHDPRVLFVVLRGPHKIVLTRFQDAATEKRFTGSLATLAAGRVEIDGLRGVVACTDVGYSGIAADDETRNWPLAKPIGSLCVAASVAAEEEERRALLMAICGAGLGALLLYVLAMTAIVRRVSRRISTVVDRARAVERGDLTARVADEGRDDIALVARAFDDAAARIARVMTAIGAVTTELHGTASRIGQAAGSVREGAVAQRKDADRSWGIADEVARALAAAAQRAEAVLDQARTGAAAAQRIASIAAKLTTATNEAVQSVASVNASVRVIASGITEVAARAEQVSSVAETTTASVVELNHTISNVRKNAAAAAAVAKAAAGDAERGQAALSSTTEGIDHIRATAREVTRVTALLEGRVAQIGEVLELVRDFTERTDMLALNAAIIASRTGEEGRAFAVVAAEIKEVARRTASSASEIGAIIDAISGDARDARRAAEAGSAAVEEGRARAHVTELALHEIFGRMRESADLAHAIALATDEQERASNQVAGAMREVSASVSEIARAAADQRAEGDRVVGAAVRLDEVIDSVALAVRDQHEGARAVATAVAALQGTLDGVATDQRTRASDGMRLRDAFAAIRRVAAEHDTSVRALEEAVAALQEHARVLAMELGHVQT